MDFINQINEKLEYLYSNGKGEAGLEIGADAGLHPDNYIRIPESMFKKWAAKVDVAEWNLKHPEKNIKIPRVFKEGDYVSSFQNEPGWVCSGKIRMVGSRKEVQYKDEWVSFSEFKMESHTYDDLAAFFTVNVGHINDDEVDPIHYFWIHAVRMWAVIQGLVLEDKNKEWVRVQNPGQLHHDSDRFLKMASDYAASSSTAAAARTTSWKKSNHCTGGTPAIGLPRRWLQKEEKWPKVTSINKIEEKKATAAFYIATHAISVHAVLAQYAPSDDHHWCMLDPQCGYIKEWEIHESIRVRMVPRDQVAGTSFVTDSIVVLKMLSGEKLAPLLNNSGQVGRLIAAYKVVKRHGMLCSVYKQWYFSGYPGTLPEFNFSQRDPAFFELVGELAIIAQNFYPGSTISQSPALRNVAEQSPLEFLKTNWAAAASTRQDLSAQNLVDAIGMVRGVSLRPFIVDMISIDPDAAQRGRLIFNEARETIDRMIETIDDGSD